MSYVRPLVLFHLRLHLDTLCSLRANLNSMAQLVNVIILYSLLCYSRQNVPHKARTQLDADHFGLESRNDSLNWFMKELNADKEAWEAAAITTVAEEPAKKTETVAPIEAETTGFTFQRCTYPSNKTSATSPLSKPRSSSTKGPMLLFVGPPGTGICQSIARVLGRPFQRISLGGVRDEAEIRCHRRTYVASGPGLIVQALRKASCVDPVILRDEVDKIGQGNFHGDPPAALLDVLDLEQNWSFNQCSN